MSTRSAIARVHGDGFKGVYHHWDGYPTALGATLYQEAQKRPLGELLTLLIDAHPAGWSSINGADLSKPAGYREGGVDGGGPICHCHGGRSGEAWPVTHESDAGMEWAYVFSEEGRTMAVLEPTEADGGHRTGMFGTIGEGPAGWAACGIVQLDGPEPAWAAIECGPTLERCSHYRWVHDPTICRTCDGDGVRDGGGHRAGYGAGYRICDSNCVPAGEAPEALRHGEGDDWHVIRPAAGFTCQECGGSGLAAVASSA